MPASSFIDPFETEFNSWNRHLFNINEIYILMTDIRKLGLIYNRYSFIQVKLNESYHKIQHYLPLLMGM